MSSNIGVVCSGADLQRSLEDPLAIHCLSRGESMGLMLVAESGIISLLAVIYVFGIIIRNAFRRRKQMGDSWRMFEEPTDLLLASLFAIDGIQSIGAVFNAGGYCQAQGVFKQFGEVGVAINTILITVYTFAALWAGRPIRSMKLTALLVTANLTTKELHGPVPLWCWITKEHLFHVRSAKRSQIDCELRRKSFMMLLYPITYSVVIIPLSAIRWITFRAEMSGDPVPMHTGATVFAGVCFASSGALNVLLYLRTRPDTALFRYRKRERPTLCPVMSISNSNAGDTDDLNDIETLGRLPSTTSSMQR
ncbi:hypothetical protein BKA70DRAFT_1316045 [Coprinopsis sp. MPI-PUGE-AT-0042]|nr:hypothetical protein BKA70DRAFT_1316045 [Coprinopsis sp. MPI-PUGE-AT-0042]